MKDYITQIWGLTGDEPPLTPTDEHAATHFALHDWQGEWLLAGGDRAEHILNLGGGCGGWLNDHTGVSVNRSRRGLLIRITEHPEGRYTTTRPRPAPTAVRVSRLTWRQAEDILRAAQADDGALFDLEA